MFLFYQQTDTLDRANTVDVNPATALERIDSWVDGTVRSLPNIAVALVLILIGFFLARWIGNLVKRTLKGRDRGNLGEILGGFLRWTLFILVFLLAMTIVLPTLSPGDLIAGLGVSSVAIGFAFKDILQNWLAGLLLLIRQPFEIGDQIVVNGYEGTVQHIETRATVMTLYNGERALIPNSEVYTNAVLVKTAETTRRTQYDVGIGYGDDIDRAVEVIERTMQQQDSVDKERGFEVLVWDLAASWVTLRVRWWIKSDRKTEVNSRSQVLRAVKLALDEARIDLPYQTQQILFHDQTEATDGKRDQQREGWPVPHEGDAPKARYEVVQENRNNNSGEHNDQESNDSPTRNAPSSARSGNGAPRSYDREN